MEFIDLKSQQARIRTRIEERIKAILDHGGYILGPEVQELEKKLAAYIDMPHCISCANGTDALRMPLMALGIGPGDAVFVPSFTFFATAEVVSLVGATPVFVDILPDTFNIDPQSLKNAIETLPKRFPNLKPKGIIAVDLFGLCADYTALHEIAKKNNLFLMEDGAQSFGATYHEKKACSLTNISTTSFFPAKPLGCYGDGGAIFCSDDTLAATLKSIRVHGHGKDKYHNIRIGLNGRLDTIQAAILLEKLSIFDEEIEARNRVAARYTKELKDIVITPKIAEGYGSVWAQYTLRTPNRDKVIAKLKEKDIPTMIYYPIPIHLQEAYTELGYREGELPVCEEMAKTVFSIPMHPYLSDREQDLIVSSVKDVLSMPQ